MKLKSFPKVAIIGADGYIGSNILAHVKTLHPDAIGTSRRTKEDLFHLDIEKLPNNLKILKDTNHTHAILTIANSNVIFCEESPEQAYNINVSGIIKVSYMLDDIGVIPVFLSSDRVFDGREWMEGSPFFTEESEVLSTSVYGRHKIAVEEELKKIKQSLIVRLSKVVGTRKGDGTMFDDMAARLTSGHSIDPPYDQFFNPLHIDDLVDGLLRLISCNRKGIYNLCSEKPCSRKELSLAMARELSIDSHHIAIGLDRSIKTPMSLSKFKRHCGVAPRHSFECLKEVASLYRESA